MAIPRSRSYTGPILFSIGFRPFFLLAALWAAVAIPLWLLIYAGQSALPIALAPAVWHVHEMIFGYGAAVVAGFLLTAIPNWTARPPVQGGLLVLLVLLWGVGRLAVLFPSQIGGAGVAAILDLAFPVVFLCVAAREIGAARNWRNLPIVGVLGLLFLGNLLVHLEALGLTATAALGNRLGVATLLMLISLIGGRVIPAFTRNWLVKAQPAAAAPAPFGMLDRIALVLTGLALVLWVLLPDEVISSWGELAAGIALAIRLGRWQGRATWREPLLWVLHLGYGWLALGFLLLALDGFVPLLPPTAALHALTIGAIGTMTLAMMTRVSLGHTGRALTAGHGTTSLYALVTIAAILRLIAPLAGGQYLFVLSLSGAAWCGAFGLYLLLYCRPLISPRLKPAEARPG